MPRELEMRFITVVCAALALCTLAASSAQAQGDKARKEIQARSKTAMENFDILEFEKAKSGLQEALAIAEKAGLGKDKLVARVYLNLGIVELAGLENEDGAREAFAAAVAIDPTIEIDVAYRTDAMAALLEAAKEEAGGSLFGDPAAGGGDCDTLEGVDHTLVDQAEPGVSKTIQARVSDSLGADRVSLFYRVAGAEKYKEVPMERGDGCSYQADIPGAAMTGESIHYSVAAMSGDEALASRGSSRSPNIIELTTGGGGGGGDDDNPLGVAATGGPGGPSGKPTVFVSVAVGTGGGYVTGATEVAQSEVDCCFAPALLHLFPEIGYYFNRQMSLSAAFRMGFAVGANVEGHATAAPAGLLRLRYALDESGHGVHVSGAVGGGVIRNTVKVEQAAEGMNTDTTVSGPFLIGGGIGYSKPMSGSMQLVGEVNALAAIPGGIKELGTCPGSGCVRPHFGLQFDFNLGILFAF
ncbi:MAG TPA: hypothetical protein VKZ63_00565 [Kofleriaceae bacterium]|nr:hypothetical protein [Kofleriaceae bacterium]